jgi:hypothetical protein
VLLLLLVMVMVMVMLGVKKKFTWEVGLRLALGLAGRNRRIGLARRDEPNVKIGKIEMMIEFPAFLFFLNALCCLARKLPTAFFI